MDDADHTLLHDEMTRAFRALMGPGFVPDYYSQMANDFTEVAVWWHQQHVPKLDPAKDVVIYHSDGEWSALFVNGKRVMLGDTYLIWDKLVSVLKIEERHNNDFLLDAARRDDHMAETLEEVEEFTRKRERREATDAEIESRAQQLEEQARRLREGIQR